MQHFRRESKGKARLELYNIANEENKQGERSRRRPRGRRAQSSQLRSSLTFHRN